MADFRDQKSREILDPVYFRSVIETPPWLGSKIAYNEVL